VFHYLYPLYPRVKHAGLHHVRGVEAPTPYTLNPTPYTLVTTGTGDILHSRFYIHNERGEGAGPCEPQPGFEGTYWQYYFINATHGVAGALSYFHECVDPLCRVNPKP
jgi:hypothetical protein